jgi:hypothetical protein
MALMWLFLALFLDSDEAVARLFLSFRSNAEESAVAFFALATKPLKNRSKMRAF